MPPDVRDGGVPEFTEAWGDRFTTAMREYIDALELSVDDESFEVETLSGQPFCGCSDCYEREGWLMAVKLAIEGYRTGEVTLVPVP